MKTPNKISGNILIMSVMALLAVTAGVFLLQSTQTAQTRISQTDNKLMEEYEMKRTLINRTALDYRKYILYENGTPNSLISTCVKSTNTFDPWKTGSYNGVNYAVSACDNTDADTNYTSDTDETLWFKVAATFPDGRQRTYYALLDPGPENVCDLAVISYLDQYASENNWNIKQGASTIASRTYSSSHNYTTQTDYVTLDQGVTYTFTYNDTYGDGFDSSSYYFRLRNESAGVNIFNKTDATPPSNWSVCTASVTMNATCVNTTTVTCGSGSSTPTPTSGGFTPTPTPEPSPTPTPIYCPYCYRRPDPACPEVCPYSNPALCADYVRCAIYSHLEADFSTGGCKPKATVQFMWCSDVDAYCLPGRVFDACP